MIGTGGFWSHFLVNKSRASRRWAGVPLPSSLRRRRWIACFPRSWPLAAWSFHRYMMLRISSWSHSCDVGAILWSSIPFDSLSPLKIESSCNLSSLHDGSIYRLFCCPTMPMTQQVSRELKALSIDADDPTLVGLTRGAAVVRLEQRTRGMLNTLRRVQLTSSLEGDSESGMPIKVCGHHMQIRMWAFNTQPANYF